MTSQYEENFSGEEPLPEHWEMRVDQRTGLPYFLNHMDHFTTWDDPRVVGQPRSMLNNLGLLRRTASPQPQPSRARMTLEEPQPVSFDNFLSAPSQAAYTQSLPRRRNQQNFFSRSPFPGDDWFRTGFDEPESDIFDDPQWPIKAHTLQRHFPRSRESSPLASHPRQTRAESPRHSPARFSPQRFQPSPLMHQEGDIRMIPIRAESSSERDTPERDGTPTERYITPTQYKQRANPERNQGETTTAAGEAKIVVPIKTGGEPAKESDSPRPKQSRTEQTTLDREDERKMSVDDSDADAILRRMSSVYDNNTASSVSDDDDEQDIPDGDPTETIHCPTEQNVDNSSGNTEEIENKQSKDNSPSPVSDKDIPQEGKLESDTTAGKDEQEGADCLEENNNKQIDLSMQAIEKINTEVEGYKKELVDFSGPKSSKEYRYLDEMLTRCQLALDNVETHGDIEVRKCRKQTVNYIESLLQTLESKSAGH